MFFSFFQQVASISLYWNPCLIFENKKWRSPYLLSKNHPDLRGLEVLSGIPHQERWHSALNLQPCPKCEIRPVAQVFGFAQCGVSGSSIAFIMLAWGTCRPGIINHPSSKGWMCQFHRVRRFWWKDPLQITASHGFKACWPVSAYLLHRLTERNRWEIFRICLMM